MYFLLYETPRRIRLPTTVFITPHFFLNILIHIVYFIFNLLNHFFDTVIELSCQ